MEEVLKRKFPKGALSFYIELYCKRKSETDNKCIVQQEALKSWISLKKSEKKNFETKYNEYLCNYKKGVAMFLKNADPYMKSKMLISDSRKYSSQNVSKNEKIDEEYVQNDLSSSKIEIDDNEDCANHIPDTQNEKNTEIQNGKTDYDNSNIEAPVSTLQDEVIPIPEPIPPKIMTGKELFLIINEREQNNLMWEELTQLQKTRYSKAVLTVKKTYLKQYREYLEHLPSEKLFNHYKIMRCNNM